VEPAFQGNLFSGAMLFSPDQRSPTTDVRNPSDLRSLSGSYGILPMALDTGRRIVNLGPIEARTQPRSGALGGTGAKGSQR
jgi:hypothetical protein